MSIEKGFNLVQILGLIGRQQALDFHVALSLNTARTGRLIMHRLSYMVLVGFHYNVLLEVISTREVFSVTA